MNCKQGDLAVVIRSTKGYEGRIVRCLKFFPAAPIRGAGNFDSWICEAPWLRGKDPLAALYGGDCAAPDAWLKPIRDPGDDAVDETLVPGYVKDEVTA